MSFIESVGGTFIVWLRSDVIPYILFGTCSVVIIVSCLLNIFLIFMLKRRKLILLPTNRYLLQLIIVDFLACGFALIPSCVTALAKSWIMSEPVCYIHAVMSTWLMLVSFGLVCFCLIERAVKQKNPKLHHAVFDSNLGVSITSVMIWAIDLGVAILPVFGISHIAYDVYQASCVVFHSSSLIYVTTVFSLTFVVSLLIFLVTSCLIFNHHRNELKKKKSDMIELLKPSQEQDNTVTSPQITNRSEKSTVSTTGIVPAVEETPRDISARRDTLAEMTMSDQETANNRSRYWRKLQNSTKHRPSRLQSVVSAVQSYDLFSDDHKDEDHHLAVTYMIVYCFLSICWLPSLILALANGFDDSIWRGWYSLTMIFAVLSFIAKPIIYMAHNRHFRQNSKMALPESVTVKVARIRNSISTAVDKLDKAVFVSPKTENNFATAVATNKAAKTWIKKVRKPDNTPIIQEECDDNVVRSESDRGPEETRESQEKDFHPNSADKSEVPIINSPSSSQK